MLNSGVSLSYVTHSYGAIAFVRTRTLGTAAAETVRRPSGAEIRRRDRRRNGRQSHRRWRLSCARLLPINRRCNVDTRWKAMVKPPPLAEYPAPSPTTG